MAPGSATARKAAFFPLPLARGCERQRQRIHSVFRKRIALEGAKPCVGRVEGGLVGREEVALCWRAWCGIEREDRAVCGQGPCDKVAVMRACGERCV